MSGNANKNPKLGITSYLFQDGYNKKYTNNKNWQGRGEKVTLYTVGCWWECILGESLWETLWRFLKKWKIELPYDPAIPFLSIYAPPKKKNKHTNLKRYMYPNVHYSIIYYCQDMEVT